jgi:hypothetical protein
MTDRSPEPSNVGPIVGGNLRASDADRDKVAAVLSTAYAEGRLTLEEHDERLDRVLHARTFDELIPITHDLVVMAPQPDALAKVPADASYTVDTSHASDEVDNMIAIFGGVNRSGKWRVRRQAKAYALFGGIDLDLRQAVFEAPVVEISGIWCFGGLDIKVPAGIEVRDQTAGIFGGTDVRDVGDHQPGAPTLVIKGMSLFGGVSVRGPKPAKRRR